MSGDDRRVLLALADEAVELQREGEALIAEISAEGPLGDLAERTAVLGWRNLGEADATLFWILRDD